MEVLDNSAPLLTVDIHLDALGVCVRRRGRDGKPGGCCHHFEGRGLEAHACGYAEGESF